MAGGATNLKESTIFPERDDVQWMKHSLSRLDAKHVEDAQVMFEYRKVIDQLLDDQMYHVPLAKRVYCAVSKADVTSASKTNAAADAEQPEFELQPARGSATVSCGGQVAAP